MVTGPALHRLKAEDMAAALPGLADLLVEAAQGEAAVSFLEPLSLQDAHDFWAGLDPRTTQIYVAGSRDNIQGTACLTPAWAPNQPHRCEVSKMLVRKSARGSGLGTRLMQHLEQQAHTGGFSLITLDCVAHGAVERFYRKLGYSPLGIMPGHALMANGVMSDTMFFFKTLD